MKDARSRRSGAVQRGGGFTLIEVVVVVGLIGVLTMLLLAAVQPVREAARRTHCANNLRQIGLALRAYESEHSCFPRGMNGVDCSPHAALLPHLEQGPLFHGINFGAGAGTGTTARDPANSTALWTRVSTFLCPSDLQVTGTPGRTNYAGNGGVASFWRGCNGLFIEGPAREQPCLRLAAIADGTSNTAAASEWVIGCFKEKEPRGSVFQAPRFAEARAFEAFVASCDTRSYERSSFLWNKSACWLAGGFSDTLMDHNARINGKSCTNGGSTNAGIWTAGSRHSGDGDGANTLFVDGHVVFVQDTTSLGIWRAMGTRNGGELANF